MVRQERTALLVTKVAGKTPPGARPNRDPIGFECQKVWPVPDLGWSLEVFGDKYRR